MPILFVTYSIDEAVFLYARVLVMAARPGSIVEDVAIAESLPRGPSFRVSTAFSPHAQRRQDILLQASGGVDSVALS